MDALPYLWIVLLIAGSAFFSASEIAYTAMNKSRVKKAAENGSGAAKLAIKIYDGYERALFAILIGNNLVNIAASSLATVIAMRMMGDAGAGVASLVMTILILIFGEIVPKIVAKQRADDMAQLAAYPLRGLMLALTPAIKALEALVGALSAKWKKSGEDALPTITEEEFAQILETAEDEGVIDEEKTELLQSALEFNDITAQEVLTPRMDMLAIDIEDDPAEIRELILGAHFSRIPVYEDSIDNVIGILVVNVYMRELVEKGTADVRALLMEPLYIHKTMKLDDALKELQRQHTHLAIVLDEFGGTLGMLTMEDILEQLVGEIWDENDDIVDECVQVGENRYACDGSMNLYDFFETVGVDDTDIDSEYTTVGGWATEMLDAVPKVGDTFAFRNLTVTVERLDGLRVERLGVTVAPAAEEDKDK